MKNSINKYMEKGKINVEKIIKDYKDYIYIIIVNNSKGVFNEADIEDAMSEVFLNILCNKQKLLNVNNLKGYIATITKNVVIDKIKKSEKIRNEIELSDNLSSNLDNVELLYDNIEINNIIKKELNNLTEEEYKIFCKYYYSSKSVKSIADELNLTTSNVKVKLHRIRKKLRENLELKEIYVKRISMILILVILFFSTYIVAKEIVKIFFKDTSKGVEKAINSGYINKIDDENYVESNGLEIKVESILMDDYNLCINFNMKINIKDNKEIGFCSFPNLLITDENNNLIVTKFTSKEKSNLSEIIKGKDTGKYPGINDGSESIHLTHKEGNEYICSYSTHSLEFPKSKKLDIAFDRVVLYSSKNDLGEVLEEKKGKWKVSIDLPEEFYNRMTDIYVLKNTNDKNLELIKANISNTGIRVNFKSKWGDKYYNEFDSEEEKLRKLNKAYEHRQSMPFEYIINRPPLKNAYIETANGKKIYPAGTSDGDGGMSTGANGNLEYTQLFNLTKYDLTDEIKVVIEKEELFFDLDKSKYIVIELQRKNK